MTTLGPKPPVASLNPPTRSSTPVVSYPCVAPSVFASSMRDFNLSTAMICWQPSDFAAIKALKPTPPRPKIITRSFGPGLARFNTAPAPVCIPHPRGANSCNSSFPFTRFFAGRTEFSLTTLRDAKLLCPKNLPPMPVEPSFDLTSL